ncbi:COX15/CtaA family protein [Roseovarius sp. LXJ103]|uniref:heme A synthase n=1 Tax=Roseovarius carneus TaxID=2853164 RepID=UPI000D61200D|nr:heme A synthase [Roseovarius carneus]MBZ8119193.1 COX15/CtaA family protein [Roseovarius carneus]PWE35178.1 heme A synthase [Pelagicola sp. LXJ1103]
MSKKRSIFEEVGNVAPEPAGTAPQGGMIDAGKRGARGAIRIWLIVLFALVLVMITVGGLTRLTDSGLSITEWRPLTGAIPPLNAADWAAEFALYQTIPEFQLQNSWMTLADFKVIYWWEWGHRQLGRVIGLVWAIGFFGFLAARKIPVGWTGRLFLLGVLGGLQGAVGWWMVYSGLSDGRLDVASYRLATHLGLAFIILGVITWFILQLGVEDRALMQARRNRDAKLFGLSTGWLHFTFLQILIGALVAGIDAGRNYTDWPLMAGGFFPPDMFALEPWWRNFFEDDGLVQFIHRMSGYLLLIFSVVVWRRGRKSANAATRAAFTAAFIAMIAQVVLGIYTVIMGAPWNIAIVHQFLAVVVWCLILRARFHAGYPPAQSVRGTKREAKA